MGKFFDTIRKNFNGHSLNNFGNWSLCIKARGKSSEEKNHKYNRNSSCDNLAHKSLQDLQLQQK